MPSTKHPRPDSGGEVWKHNEPIIRRLYETERKTLKEVKHIMENQHGFPVIPLSTYETKLRDELKLRKKLKKEDWIAVYQHYINKGGGKTSIYLNGNKIPWVKAWKEIRRSGARDTVESGMLDQAIMLPVGVSVRTPSPAPGLASPPLLAPERRSRSPLQLAYLSTSDLNYGAPRDDSQNINQLSQISTPRSDQKVEVGIFFESILERSKEVLRNIPWIMYQNTMALAVEDAQHVQNGHNSALIYKANVCTMEYLVGVKFAPGSPKVWEMTLLSTLFPFLPRPNQAPSLLVPTQNFDVYHLLAKAIYMVSNHLVYDNGIISATCPDICEMVFNKAPSTILLGLFLQNHPTARATWEFLADCAGKYGYRDSFTLLMAAGLRHDGWIIPNEAFYLASATSMGLVDVVHNLLKVGARPDGGKLPNVGTVSPFLEAAAIGNVECAELLIENCENKHGSGVGSAFGQFIDAFMKGYFLVKRRRDQEYLPTTFKYIGIVDQSIRVSLSLENESHSRVLEAFLNRGANVDFEWGYDREFSTLYHIRYSSGVPKEWRLTLLEYCYFCNIELFRKLLPYSKHTTGRILRSDICLSARQGEEALHRFLTSQPANAGFDMTEFLGLILAEQLLAKEEHTDMKAMQELADFGVNPSFKMLCVNIQDISHEVVAKARVNGCNEHFSIKLGLLLRFGAVIDGEVLECGVQEEHGIDALIALSQHGANVSEYGAFALSTAARLDNYEAVSWLLDAGVDINGMVKLRSGDKTLSTIALATVANINEFGYWISSNKSASCEMIRYLIDHGAVLRSGPDDTNGFKFLCHFLFNYGHDTSLLEKVKLFVEKLNLRNLSDSGACLLKACLIPHFHYGIYSDIGKQRVDAFKLLLQCGALSREGCLLPALIYLGGPYDLIQKVLEASDDIDAYSEGNPSLTALQSAAFRGDRSLVEQLVRRGANVNQPPSLHGMTALTAAYSWMPKLPSRMVDRINLMEFLIKEGADVNAPMGGFYEDLYSTLLLHGAARDGDIGVVLLLIHYGADWNALAIGIFKEIGYYPLDAAAERGRLDVVQLLLNIGAISNVPGQTGYDGAIKRAKERNQFAIVDLIEKKVEKDRWSGRDIAASFREGE